MITAKKTGRGDLSLRDNLTRLVPAIGTRHAAQNSRVQSVTPPVSRKSPEPSRLPTDNAKVRPTALDQQGWLDDLPHLPNRAQFSHHLQQAILTAQRRNKPLALLLIDLDHFREVNVTFGHQWGEVLWQQVGARLQNTLRKSDMVARLGGDEFAVLLVSGGDEKGAIRVAGRILHALEQPFVIAGYTVDVGVRVGIALYAQHDEDAHALMRRAVVATNMAKHAGSGHALYSADHDRYSPDRLVLKADLRHAIKHDQLVLHYQPQVNLTTGHVVQVEALVRWQHPKHGLLFPDQFIPLAEQMGVIRPLSSWVLNTTLRQCQTWQQEKLSLRVSVNLSMWDLQDMHLPDTLARVLRSWNVAHDHLEVEITESVIAADPERTVQILTRLREMDVRIAIDDFGAGYSSLLYLKQLPVHTIKIDKSFIKDMRDEHDAAIVRSTINLSHTLGLEVVAEGVEDKEICDMLRAMGCDFAQGHYLSCPLPAPELTRWLQTLPRGGDQRPVIRLPHG
jgi:diguanylate cyclase (GGDEF)-like protein